MTNMLLIVFFVTSCGDTNISSITGAGSSIYEIIENATEDDTKQGEIVIVRNNWNGRYYNSHNLTLS